jgi:hypothetical protein
MTDKAAKGVPECPAQGNALVETGQLDPFYCLQAEAINGKAESL